MIDNVNHPAHYTSDKSGVECIEITRHRNFNIGNAIKYLWRAGLKDSDASAKHVEDLKKAIFYITREIENIEDDIADAEDFEAAKANSDWVRKLFAPIFDEAMSAKEYDDLAASKANHPAKGIRVEDCEVVEDEDDEDWDGVAEGWDCGVTGCDMCADENYAETPAPTAKAWIFNGKDFVETNAFSSFKFVCDDPAKNDSDIGGW